MADFEHTLFRVSLVIFAPSVEQPPPPLKWFEKLKRHKSMNGWTDTKMERLYYYFNKINEIFSAIKSLKFDNYLNWNT